MDQDRYFTVEVATSPSSNKIVAKDEGLYVSKIPYNAVKKAYNRLTRDGVKKVPLNITLREVRGALKGKLFHYKVHSLPSKKSVLINGKQITFKYETVVQSIPKNADSSKSKKA